MPYGAPSAPMVGATPTDTAGLRRAAIVLFWSVAGGSALLTIAMFARRQTWRSEDATFDDLQNADNLVGVTALLVLLAGLAAVIVVSIWSLRTARHAKQTGATSVSPGLSCGGWYIPFANLIVPFVQLRRIVDHRRRPRNLVNAWQGLLIVAWLFSAVTNNVGGSIDARDSFDEVSSTLTTQSVVALAATVLLAVTAAVAGRAMSTVDGV